MSTQRQGIMWESKDGSSCKHGFSALGADTEKHAYGPCTFSH